MSFQTQDVSEGRRLMGDGRRNRLALGDKLLAVAPPGQEGVLDLFCDEISLSPQTAREYRHTARMCTPGVRDLVDHSSVHVSYSVLREGARLGAAGKPHDEEWFQLRSLLEEAEAAGRGRLTVAHYRRVLGTTPPLKELLGSSGDGDASVSEYLNALKQNAPEREKIIQALVAEDAQLRDAVQKAINENRRRDGDGSGKGPDRPRTDKATAFVRDIIRLRDQANGFMHRYPRPPKFAADQQEAAEEAAGTLEILATFTRVSLGLTDPPGVEDRAGLRETVAV
ncbi:hypothetical protein [Streptomyces sp. NPDC048057]|uniref:hypothetical protein n=1 Tax=Streptomyces sp. NPDC048057 TaxID=3155628 RepID=UPI0033DB6FA8